MANTTQHSQGVVSQWCHDRVPAGHPTKPNVSRCWVVAARPGYDPQSVDHSMVLLSEFWAHSTVV